MDQQLADLDASLAAAVAPFSRAADQPDFPFFEDADGMYARAAPLLGPLAADLRALAETHCEDPAYAEPYARVMQAMGGFIAAAHYLVLHTPAWPGSQDAKAYVARELAVELAQTSAIESGFALPELRRRTGAGWETRPDPRSLPHVEPAE